MLPCSVIVVPFKFGHFNGLKSYSSVYFIFRRCFVTTFRFNDGCPKLQDGVLNLILSLYFCRKGEKARAGGKVITKWKEVVKWRSAQDKKYFAFVEDVFWFWCVTFLGERKKILLKIHNVLVPFENCKCDIPLSIHISCILFKLGFWMVT